MLIALGGCSLIFAYIYNVWVRVGFMVRVRVKVGVKVRVRVRVRV
jgi:hypothetical protein